MITKTEIKLINSLSIKKYREINNLFIVEGNKIVDEIIESDYKIKYLIHTEKYNPPKFNSAEKTIQTNIETIKKISNFKTAPSVVALVVLKYNQLIINNLKNKLTLAIDEIQDPGNLGTIVRICDWFGIENIICSENSVDIYNPKVIQASMGAFLRVNVFYKNLENFIIEYKKQTENICYGAFLDGQSIYDVNKNENSLLVMGNEGNGISESIENLIESKIFIPPYFSNGKHSESLNLSVATAIVCNEFRKK